MIDYVPTHTVSKHSGENAWYGAPIIKLLEFNHCYQQTQQATTSYYSLLFHLIKIGLL